MIYLRTIFSAPNEIKFLKLNIMESFNYIDKFIICEFNKTHTGLPRELSFHKYSSIFTKEEMKKIIYLEIDLSNNTEVSNGNDEIAHQNERLMRGYFASKINLDKNDIVISIDADEVIYKENYEKIINYFKYPWRKIAALPLRQYFYKVNYLWENIVFKSPIACRASYFLKEYPSQWRDAGKPLKFLVGAHFSWCLTIQEMLEKINAYAHNGLYKHLADEKVLTNAIKNKEYPFEPDREFNISVLDINKDKKEFPKSIYEIIDQFAELIGE